MAKAATVKPFRLDECKSGPNGRVHEITVNKWKGMVLTSIRKEEKWIQFLPDTGTIKEWGPRKETDRSLDGDQKAANARHIDDMLEFVAQFAPSCLYCDITAKAKSLGAVNLSRDTRRGRGGLEMVNFVSLLPLTVIQGGGGGGLKMVNFVSRDK